MRKKKRSVPRFEYAMKMILAGLVGCTVAAYADVPAALVGGQTLAGDAYAALLPELSAGSSLTPVVGLPTGVSIISVGLNSSGLGLIGGSGGGLPYAAFVASDGTLGTELPLPNYMSAGDVYGVALNQSGFGLVLGVNNGSGDDYVAHVSQDGTVNSVVVDVENVFGPPAIALNDLNVGLVGGEGSMTGSIYVAYVASDLSISQLMDTPGGGNGAIYSVALNNLSNGIVGGHNASNMYAAFVTPAGSSEITLSVGGQAYSVAINSSGYGLIGGQDGGGKSYAAYAAPDLSFTALFDTPFSGSINQVALNDSGVGIIGGSNNLNLYAAFVQPDHSLLPIFSGSDGGTIYAVAINSAGVGLIGGQLGMDAYLALVAPNGTPTPIDVPDGHVINSIAMQKASSILDQVVPKSIGPYGSIMYTQLAAAAALENRFIQQNRVWTKRKNKTSANNIAYNETNLASNEEIAVSPKTASTPRGTIPTFKENSIWVEPFGNYVHLKEQGSIPGFTNEIGGALLGYDRQEQNYIVGLALGYAFNYVDYSKGLGHAKLQEEMGSLYGSYYSDHFWFSAALWGGFYQLTNDRHPIPKVEAKGKAHGWVLEPHLEFASPWAMDKNERYYIEPFAQFDWVNNWQDTYSETGSSGLNVHLRSFYNSLLQTEVGLRFYERFAYGWGDFCLEEKLSYVNQAPFDVQSTMTSFVSSASAFPVALASPNAQNLGSVQVLGCLTPRNTAYPYGGFSLQATAGSSYQSYFVSVFTGTDF